MRNNCSNNLNFSDNVRFYSWKYGDHRLQKMKRINNVFFRYDISKCEWDTWLRLFNGHFRLIHCFKGVSKTQILRGKGKQPDNFQSLFCLYLFRIRSHTNSYPTNGALRRFCLGHLDIFSKNVAKKVAYKPFKLLRYFWSMTVRGGPLVSFITCRKIYHNW